MDKRFRIIFMGTPEFSVPTLTALHHSRHEVVLVVTQPDRRKGRGRKLEAPEVKEAALNFGYEVIQPESVKTEEFLNHIRLINPDMFIVIAFGHVLPKSLLEMPKYGSINIHASLLPKYRGPSPIPRAIIDGETETGISIMLMNEGLDTGDILLDQKIQILPDDTSETLHQRLAVLGAGLLIRTLDSFDSIKPVTQNHEHATYAPLMKKTDGHIDWKKPAKQIETFIRGMTPWPGAFTFNGNKRLKIFRAIPVELNQNALPGTVFAKQDELIVATGNGALAVKEIQGESGKKLNIRDFLRGNVIESGIVLT